MIFFFFFQAEDGIRDFHVTGVQTCALPILPRLGVAGAGHAGGAGTARLGRLAADRARRPPAGPRGPAAPGDRPADRGGVVETAPPGPRDPGGALRDSDKAQVCAAELADNVTLASMLAFAAVSTWATVELWLNPGSVAIFRA